MGRMPERPASSDSQKGRQPIPIDETTPSPVTTTRRRAIESEEMVGFRR